MANSLDVDDFEGSDYDERPTSKQERKGSRGKGHLELHDSHDESDDDSNSVRRQRNSAVQRLRKKEKDLLRLD